MSSFVSNPPDAASLMTSARSFGNYDLAGALADLIDNSIRAKARNVFLTCVYNGGDPEIRVVDDGHGLSPAELRDAMRPASTNPIAERSSDDLGRFGWGLKSASFSQCAHLTVLSRRDGNLSGASWDLTNISGWRMEIIPEAEAKILCNESLLEQDGTEVIWNNCDRLSENRALSQEEFNSLIAAARARLGLTFHRYLSGEARTGRSFRIALNNEAIPPYDPFYRSHPATQTLEPETLTVEGGEKIDIRPFVLPHYKFLKSTEFERIAGDEGMLKNQGFYVYRNDRLIVHGTWFRLVHHGQLSQLVRISIDVPNSLDSMWKLTLDKTEVQLPSALKKRLRQLVRGFKSRSSKVHRSKGGKIKTGANDVPIWHRLAPKGEIQYEINRDHPLVRAAYSCDEEQRDDAIAVALSAIEHGFPVAAFSADVVRDSESINQTVNSPGEFRDFLKAAIPVQLSLASGDVANLTRTLQKAEPFKSHWPAVHEYLVQEGLISE